jgi:hypothetical protein
MPPFDIVFEKLRLMLESDDTSLVVAAAAVSSATELDEIDELRRLCAEIQEPEPLSFTTT